MPRAAALQRKVRPPVADARCRDIAARLNNARLDAGMSLRIVAQALDRSEDDVARLETGRAPITLPVLLDWARALRLDLVLAPGGARPGNASTFDDRLLAAYAAAEPRTRAAIHALLSLDTPPPAPVDLVRRGRPIRAAQPVSLRLSQDQLILLRASRVPYTGNRLLTALKLTGASITALADATCLRYRRLAALVAGRGIVPAGYPEEIASTFGCLPSDLFPLAADAPAPTRHVETPDADAAGDGLDHPSGHRARATAPA